MKERRLIKQVQPGQPLGNAHIVFHWQRVYALTNFHRAAQENRNMTEAEIAEDAQEAPRYSFTAFRVPQGTAADRQKLRDLLQSAGFRKRGNGDDWTTSKDGDEPVLRLKLALRSKGIAAVHYNDIPEPMLIPVSVDGQL